MSDDALAAGRILLERRQECLNGSEPGCLDRVDEPGSAIDAADRLAVVGSSRAASSGTVVEISTLHLVGAQGDAAILGADVVPAASAPGTTERQPVTILVMRTETGWRLREVFSA